MVKGSLALCKLALQQAEVPGEVAPSAGARWFCADGEAEADGRMQHGVGFDDREMICAMRCLTMKFGVEPVRCSWALLYMRAVPSQRPAGAVRESCSSTSR